MSIYGVAGYTRCLPSGEAEDAKTAYLLISDLTYFAGFSIFNPNGEQVRSFKCQVTIAADLCSVRNRKNVFPVLFSNSNSPEVVPNTHELLSLIDDKILPKKPVEVFIEGGRGATGFALTPRHQTRFTRMSG